MLGGLLLQVGDLRAPEDLHPAGMDVLSVRVEETTGQEAQMQLSLDLPEPVQHGQSDRAGLAGGSIEDASGALMRLAAMAASMEMPVPQKTISPSLILRAAAIAMSSRAV